MPKQLNVYTATSHGTTCYVLDLRRFKEGRKYFETKKEADLYAKQRNIELDNYGAEAFSLSYEKRCEYVATEARLKSVGATLQQCLDFFFKHHTAKTDKLLSEALEECVKEKSKVGRRIGYTDKIRTIIGSIVTGGDIKCQDFTRTHAEAWLDGSKWKPITKKYAMKDANTFFNYCIDRGWASINPFAKMLSITPEGKPPGILSNDQCVRLLKAAQSNNGETVPYFTLALFAGIRPEEIEKMDWSMVNLKDQFVEVPSVVSKTRRRRIVRLSNNAVAWLSLSSTKKGSICPVNFRKKSEAIRRSAGFKVSKNDSGDEWAHDCLRHSFASYHLAQYDSADKTATQMGHENTKMLFSHYRELVRPNEAAAFWAIMPPQPENLPTCP